MRKKLIVANWKAYLASRKAVRAYMASFAKAFSPVGTQHAEIVFCVPFPYLAFVSTESGLAAFGGKIAVGAQDVFWEPSGPYTGEVTPLMLKDTGVSYVIVGHSERRKHFGESDATANKKIHAALAANLQIILCVGEWVRAMSEDAEKKNLDFVKDQVQKALAGVGKTALRHLVIAYEPVWAISGNQGVADTSAFAKATADTPENAARMIMFIRRILARMYDAKTAKSLRVLYGGSVSSHNIASFAAQETIDGVLVGSASASPQEFLRIIEEVARVAK